MEVGEHKQPAFKIHKPFAKLPALFVPATGIRSFSGSWKCCIDSWPKDGC